MKTIILDDERQSIELLEPMVLEIANDKVFCYTKSEELLMDIEEGRVLPELVFMDIKLDKANGIDIAGKILNRFPEAQIVFISGYDDYYLDVYDVNHVFFLRKPISRAQLKKAYNRVVDKITNSENQTFHYRYRQANCVVPYHDILFFENAGRKVRLYTDKSQEPFEFYEKLDDVMLRLDEHFIRCHKSYIVNLSHVDLYRKGSYVIQEREIPISRQYTKACQEAFDNYLENRILHKIG